MRLLICWLVAALLLGCNAAQSKPLAGEAGLSVARRPNIILIMADDQGYGDLARNGNPIIRTPNIDRLYDEALRFEDFHVSPTCAPTRSSLMSGKHEFKNGVTHTIFERERMSLKTHTIAQVLKAAGYTNGIFGKWHLGDEPAYQPDQRGFDEVYIHGGGGIGQGYPGTCGDAPGNRYFDPVLKHNGKFEKTTGYCTDLFFGQAIKWAQSVKDKEQPFFMYITPNAPHAPLQCPADYEKMYTGKVPLDTAKFFGMITNIDDNVGKLMAKLKEWKLDENTLVIYMNDNGGQPHSNKIFNAGMRGNKGSAYNGGARAMSLWRWPGTIKPGSCDKLTAHIDYFATFADLAGQTVKDNIDGYSLLPLLVDPKATWHEDRMLFTHAGRWGGRADDSKPMKLMPNGKCSVRFQQYLMVYEKEWTLYDLKADPGEKENIAGKHPEIIAKLSKAYDQWWEDCLPCLENETAWKTARSDNPFKTDYWKQYGGPGPNNVPVGKTAKGNGE